MAKKTIIDTTGIPSVGVPTLDVRAALPKPKAIHPFGSKILVEVLRADEVMGTNLFVGSKMSGDDGAPQALIIEVGPDLKPEVGLKAGQRIYWTGRGTEVKDPRTTEGRVRALLEISNVLAIIDDQD